VVLGDRNVYTLPPVAGTGLKFGSSSRRRPGRPADGFDWTPEEGERVIGDFEPYLKDRAGYRSLRLQVGYYVVQESRRFTLARDGRRLVVTNCDGQMFKFGPLLGNAIMAAVDGERDFQALARWAAGE
jgi:sarcosine oxidase